MKHQISRGFTIVELLVVIVIIAILAALTSTMYLNSQTQARDLVIKHGAMKTADAIQFFNAKNGHFPRGGWGSDMPIGSATECTKGGNGFVSANTSYTCTLADTLIASGYIPRGFYDSLPKNTAYDPNSVPNLSIMVYVTSSGRPAGDNKALVMYSQEGVLIDDAEFTRVLQSCGIADTVNYGPRKIWGMRRGICVSY